MPAHSAAPPLLCAGFKGLDVFELQGTFDPVSGQLATSCPLPITAALTATAAQSSSIDQPQQQQETPVLATMDVFAGCGGITEGLHQAGVTETKWAIEFNHQAAEAFKLNNPDAAVFSTDCNAILVVS